MKKSIKHCIVGEFEFDLSVNRSILLKAFNKVDKMWDLLQQFAEYSDEIEQMQKAKELKEIKNSLKIIKFVQEFEEEKDNFVKFILPYMLQEGGMEGEFKDIIAKSECIIDFAKENDVYYDIPEEEFIGFASSVFEFAISVFTISEQKARKPNVRLQMS